MKIGIVGSRNASLAVIANVQDWIVANVRDGELYSSVVTGGARGVDEAALRICIEFGVRVLVLPPPNSVQFPGTSFGQRCAIRNRWIAEECDRLVAFWDGISKGTEMTIGFAEKLGKPVEVISP